MEQKMNQKKKNKPVWMVWRSRDKSHLREIVGHKKLTDALEKLGIFLRPIGLPGSGKFRAYDSLWQLVGVGTLEELVDQLAPETPISDDKPTPDTSTRLIDHSFG